MASTITAAEFKDALSRYNEVLATAKPTKEGQTSMEELDNFRYQYAPMNFSKNAGKTLDFDSLKKLIEWKLRHGVFRGMLTKQVASNTAETVESALKEAFDHYNSNSDDVLGTIEKIKAPIKGVGPAAASLILSVYDPQNVVFFSDELYAYLVNDDASYNIKYNTQEFEELTTKAKEFMGRIKCTPIELEKAAFTIVQDNKPVKEIKEPSSRGRGRPKLAESEKKPKKETVPGRGRGRPLGVKKTTNGVAAKTKKEKVAKAAAPAATPGSAKKPGRPSAASAASTPATGKKRGRPAAPASESGDEEDAPHAKKAKGTPKATPGRGRPKKA